jgi:phosphate/phosphite/phosphonate ABC transporter binding protein
MVNQFKGVEKYLNENTSLNVKLRLYPTSGELGGYTAVVKDISEGKISFAYLASVTTIQANGNGPVIPFACAQKNGSPTYRGDLVVRADSPYQSLEDLKGKKVSGTSKSSTSGNLMPSSWLKSLEIDPTTYFEGGMMYLGSHDKAIQAVIKGTIDGAFINESTMYKFNKDEQVTRSLWRHPPVPEFPFVVNTEKVTDAQLAEVKEAMLRMHETDLEDIQRVEPNYEKWVELNLEDCMDIKAAIDDVYGPVFYDLEEWGK